MKNLKVNPKDLNDFFLLISEAKKENKLNNVSKNTNLNNNNLTEENNNSLDNLINCKSKSKNALIEKSLGLLSEPSNTKHKNDPLTPIDKKFATIEDLNKHYNLFLSRIQQQLSTLGGGGESNISFIDVPTSIVNGPIYKIKERDYYIGVNYSGAVTITLPKGNREGKIFIVKDELGEASKGTNRNITIIPSNGDLIDGKTKVILAYDYGALTFIWRGNSWRII